MPLYEYECRSCGTVIDVRHGFDEINAEPCPTCAGPLTRRFSPTGIVFKGSGFYVTDSRKSAGSGESTPAPAGGEAAASAAAPASTPSESSKETAGGSAGPAAPPSPAPKKDSSAA